MSAWPAGQAVFVETAARLHFGVLDLRGERGRWFGGLGAAAPGPTLRLSASPAEQVDAEGAEADRAAAFAARFLAHHGIRSGARLRVHRALPPHAGLGSGTQLALAVARALAELYGLPADAPALTRAVGRARRSAVGTWTFAGGGLVVEGGRPANGDGCGPLLVRLPFPPDWRCVVVIPEQAAGISGAEEADAFDRLPVPPPGDVERVAHLVLMALLPALAEGDIEGFGGALTRIQEVTGRWFASIQGGAFASEASGALVRRLAEWGARGVGQSSWGPSVYGVVAGERAAVQLAARARDYLGGAGVVYEGAFPREGARVWLERRDEGDEGDDVE